MTTESNQLQAAQATGLQSATDKPPRFTGEQIESGKITESTRLPSLVNAPVSPMPMSTAYWSPTEIGESIRGWVFGVGQHGVADIITGEIKMQKCMFFLRQVDSSQVERVVSAGKQLVGIVETCIANGEIIPASTLTPIVITFAGERKNKKNALVSKIYTIRAILTRVIEE